MGGLSSCYNIDDLREAARRRLPRSIFEFVDLGSEDGVALVNNREAFQRLKLLNRVMVDVTSTNVETSLFGKPMGMPLAISPTGLAGLCWHEGELALAKAAAAAGVPCTLATGSVTPMERLVKEAGGRLWFQLYMWRDRALSHGLIRRARDAGFEALLLTADTGLGGNREHNKRNGFSMPFKLSSRNVPDLACHPGWLTRVMLPYILKSGIPRHENYPEGHRKSIMGPPGGAKHARGEDMTWKDAEEVRKLWPGTFIVKGILRADDAKRAVECGADGIIVSNHGGRNMDSAMAPMDVLPSIVAAVGDRTTIILDSGARRGSDIVKALALGAKAVMMGRGTLYGVAVSGEAGATHALSLLHNELRQTMGYVGCRSIGEINADILGIPQR
jgi:isopentenyl diphosphate isomerase/L-lactate dehydrogenase-like FMN-dependent dehydrogenase